MGSLAPSSSPTKADLRSSLFERVRISASMNYVRVVLLEGDALTLDLELTLVGPTSASAAISDIAALGQGITRRGRMDSSGPGETCFCFPCLSPSCEYILRLSRGEEASQYSIKTRPMPPWGLPADICSKILFHTNLRDATDLAEIGDTNYVYGIAEEWMTEEAVEDALWASAT